MMRMMKVKWELNLNIFGRRSSRELEAKLVYPNINSKTTLSGEADKTKLCRPTSVFFRGFI